MGKCSPAPKKKSIDNKLFPEEYRMLFDQNVCLDTKCGGGGGGVHKTEDNRRMFMTSTRTLDQDDTLLTFGIIMQHLKLGALLEG